MAGPRECGIVGQSIKKTVHQGIHKDRPLVVIVQADFDSQWNEMGVALLGEAEKRDWRLLDIKMAGGSLVGEERPIGAIIRCLPTDPLVKPLREMGCPVLRIGRVEHPDDPEVPAVLPDFVEAGRMAAEHFALRGFQNLAVVGLDQYKPMEPIRKGLFERGEALGCTCRVHLFETQSNTPDDWDFKAHRYERRSRELIDWLKAIPKPVGLLACNESTASVISIMCQRSEIHVPGEVALLTVGDDRYQCQVSHVPISAVDTDPADLGRTAMRRLSELIAGQAVPPQTYVTPRGIVTRRSTDILAVDHVAVAQAIRFMWDHMDKDLSVDDVALAVNKPRHTLHRLFRKHLKRGINEELRRARLERFRELLRTTDQTVEQLAPQVGFKTASFLTLAFRKTFSQTPRQYRLQARSASPETDT